MSDAAENSPTSSAVQQPRRWRSVVFVVLLIAALIGGAVWLVQRGRAPQGGGGPGGGFPLGPGGGGGGLSVTVGSVLAAEGRLPVVLEALGTVTPAASVTLVPQVSGVLTEVLFTEGQQVTKGQLLARIDPRPFEQALAQARSQRARDAAQLAAARVTLSRYEQLWQQDSIARQDVDTQSALVQQLQAAVQADEASERQAQLNLDYSTMRAPISGRIGLRAVDPGNLVSSGTAGGIATIAQVAPIDVVFVLPQERVAEVLAAQQGRTLPVQALDGARTRTLAEGRFLTLDNQINTSTGTVRAKARFDNAAQALFPNQFVNVRLTLGQVEGVLVPVTALRTGPQGDYVYAIDAERVAHMRAVVRGRATADQVLITQGLQAGERVVSEGGDRVKDGGRVQLAEAQGSEQKTAPGQSGSALSASEKRAKLLDSLPPEQRAKVQAMTPEERRAFFAQRRNAQGGAQGGAPAPASASAH